MDFLASPAISLTLVKLSQWESEIDKHTSDRIFRGVAIYDSKKSSRRITDNDIVLASYGEVSRSCPFPDKHLQSSLKGVDRQSGKDFEAAENDSAAVEMWIQANMGTAGALHQVQWYRVRIPFYIPRLWYTPVSYI